MNRSAKYSSVVIVLHLLVNLVHGLAHRELHISLTRPQEIFVVAVVLVGPLLAGGLLWTAWRRSGLLLLALSMTGSLLFGLYHHFLAMSSDHVHAQPASSWGLAFVSTAYGLLLIEAIGAYLGVHFLWMRPSNPAVEAGFSGSK